MKHSITPNMDHCESQGRHTTRQTVHRLKHTTHANFAPRLTRQREIEIDPFRLSFDAYRLGLAVDGGAAACDRWRMQQIDTLLQQTGHGSHRTQTALLRRCAVTVGGRLRQTRTRSGSGLLLLLLLQVERHDAGEPAP